MDNTEQTIVIDLSKHGGPVYIGRPKGLETRRMYNLDDADNSTVTIEVIVPKNTYTINSSFFLGLFGDSIRNSGSKDNFFKKFTFTSDKIFTSKFEDYIRRALYKNKPIID